MKYRDNYHSGMFSARLFHPWKDEKLTRKWNHLEFKTNVSSQWFPRKGAG